MNNSEDNHEVEEDCWESLGEIVARVLGKAVQQREAA